MKKLLTLAAVALIAAACCNNKTACPDADAKDIASITFDNSYFYPNGAFDAEKGKDAYIALMEYHNYPVFDGIREMLWVSDYGTGQFTKLGLGAICPINNEEDLYMLQDLYLLPGQMLPEHWHEKPDGLPVKMEAWFVRNGQSYIVGVGEDNLAQFPEVVVPECHMDGTVTTAHVALAKPGQLVKLSELKSRHWQFAGPEGAIMTEVANVHSNAAVRHSDQGVNDNFLGK